jgi:hypothetical protein
MHHLHLVQTIGGTPIVELRHLSPKAGVRLFVTSGQAPWELA